MKQKYVLCVIAAGSLWGFIGLFRRHLEALGGSTVGVIAVRCGIAAIAFGLTLLIREPKGFRVRLRDFWCFLGAGIVSLLLFTLCYFRAMQLMSLSTAAILLYTAPCFVMLLSVPCFHEKLTGVKLAAMVLAFAGCCFVSGLGAGRPALTATGLLFGLGSGLCYALYSIFGRFALNRGYSSLTINFYACLLAALGALICGGGTALRIMTASRNGLLWCLGTGLISCYLPYLFYTYGLSGLENGEASIMASIEPVVATAVGIVFYHERLTALGAAGIVLVLAAIILLNHRPQRSRACKTS